MVSGNKVARLVPTKEVAYINRRHAVSEEVVNLLREDEKVRGKVLYSLVVL
jgi:hypothetical protein